MNQSSLSENKQPSVSVLIVNYNAGRELAECLETVFAQDYDGPIDISVIDNASCDDSLDLIKQEAKVRLIKNETNRGFSAAMNQGIDQSEGELVLCLNFDVRLSPDFLTQAVLALTEDKQVGAVSGKLLGSAVGGQPILDSTGITMEKMIPADRSAGLADDENVKAGQNVFGVSGAAALYRRAMLDSVRIGQEYFDEDYFMVAEDVDLAWRALQKGWICRYVPTAVAVHVRGVTRKNSKPRQAHYNRLGNRNRYLTIYKNLSWKTLRKHWLKISIWEVRHLFRMTRHYGPITALGSVLGATLLLPEIHAKRREIQKDVRVDPAYLDHYFFD